MDNVHQISFPVSRMSKRTSFGNFYLHQFLLTFVHALVWVCRVFFDVRGDSKNKEYGDGL